MARTKIDKIDEASLPDLPDAKKKERRVLRQAEIQEDLWDAVDKEAKKLRLSNREVFEYGLRAFLAKARAR